ncbi:MAG: hypothetical protein JF586_07120 [Burkholderiales bacterium]|nr:hypothetical protein [Burkholderiales bacterium]
MSDPIVPIPGADALLAQADALHDDDPARALELLRAIEVTALDAAKLGRLSFLLDHVTGEKFGLWDEAVDGLRKVVARAGAEVTPLILRHAAIAAHMVTDDALAHEWTQALAASADAPLDKARALVALGTVQFSLGRLPAEAAGRHALHALRPLGDLLEAPGSGLDAAFGAVTNNIASELLERPLPDLAQPDLRDALARAAGLAQRFWEHAGTWVNHERARYLSAMVANALGDGDAGVAHAQAGLALLDEFDVDHGQAVDRAFLELELAAGLRLAGRPGRPEALARALALASRFGQPWLDRWFSDRQTRNEALAAHYGRS